MHSEFNMDIVPRGHLGIKTFLRDRLTEEMEKLLSAARGNDAWFESLSQICRGRGCAAACVDHAAEVVAVADSFSTAAALYRLEAGAGAAPLKEMAQLAAVVESEADDIITAAFQNLHRLIWPTREESFDRLRALVAGDAQAEAGLWGVEARAELALICKTDKVAYECIKALIACEELRSYLRLKEKKLEIEGLDKLLGGDKNAIAVMKRLTPSLREKLQLWWAGMSRWGKTKFCFSAFFAALLAVMWAFKKTGLERTLVGKAFANALTIVLYIATGFLAFLIGIWFVLQGTPMRDNVKGPNPNGIQMLHKLVLAADDKEQVDAALESLELMLMGQEPTVAGKAFLRKRAAKFVNKAPEATEALNTLEYMFVLQQLGKDAAMMDEATEKIPWPTWSELYPPSAFKLREARSKLWEKVKRFFFFAKVHPIMKKWAQHSGERMVLYNNVEVSLTMCKDNAEEFAALDALRDGNRVDTARLAPLQRMVDKINQLDQNGADATSLKAAMTTDSRTGNVKKIFGELDTDGSGTLDYAEAEEAIHRLADSVGFTMDAQEIDEAFEAMDADGSGEVDFHEFTKWWTDIAVVTKKQKKMQKIEQMEAAGLLPESPKPKELQLTLKVLTKLLPSIGLRMRAFETLEDMCPDDDTFECLQEAYYLCELKRMMMRDRNAFSSILGLEAICLLPNLLDGDPALGIEPNEAAREVVLLVQKGDKAAIAAKDYIKQPEYRRLWGMLTQRQRRVVMILLAVVSVPVLHVMGFFGDLDLGSFINAGMNNTDYSDSGSWAVEMPEPEPEVVLEPEPEAEYVDDRGSSPSFYVLGLLPLATSCFVSFFGQRIASLITLITVFTASAGATISAALADREPGSDLTPAQFVGVSAALLVCTSCSLLLPAVPCACFCPGPYPWASWDVGLNIISTCFCSGPHPCQSLMMFVASFVGWHGSVRWQYRNQSCDWQHQVRIWRARGFGWGDGQPLFGRDLAAKAALAYPRAVPAGSQALLRRLGRPGRCCSIRGSGSMDQQHLPQPHLDLCHSHHWCIGFRADHYSLWDTRNGKLYNRPPHGRWDLLWFRRELFQCDDVSCIDAGRWHGKSVQDGWNRPQHTPCDCLRAVDPQD